MSATIIDLRAERMRRRVVFATRELEAEFGLPAGTLARNVEDLARRCPRHIAPRPADDGGFELSRDDLIALACLGRVRPARVAAALRARSFAGLRPWRRPPTGGDAA